MSTCRQHQALLLASLVLLFEGLHGQQHSCPLEDGGSLDNSSEPAGCEPVLQKPREPPKIAIPASELFVASEPVCKLSGKVDETCGCTYESVTDLNSRVVRPVLSRLVAATFFRYFKVNIYCDCPLWPDDSMCMLRACSVCECDSSEVPQTWLDQERSKQYALHSPHVAALKGMGRPSPKSPAGSDQDEAAGGSCDSQQCAAEVDSRVNSTVEPEQVSRLMALPGWRGFNNPWMAEGEEGEEYLYINLLVNPERYTGYAGEHAHRIWNAIYSQSCFDAVDCPEKRVFYRLISGMHSSISAHISANYLLDEDAGLWGYNITDFRKRLGQPEHQERVQNLYFAYLFVLRAVLKAGPLLSRFNYTTGVPEDDAQTAALLQQLVSSPEVATACPMPFDEGRLWKGHNATKLQAELQAAFVNITRIMDCVGCEKCKLWGKLQTLGVATALKVLFSSSDCQGAVPTQPGFATLALERNEVIALINLLERFSASIYYYHELAAEAQLEGSAVRLAVQQQDTLV